MHIVLTIGFLSRKHCPTGLRQVSWLASGSGAPSQVLFE
jgi:hypothetical protein